MNKELEQAMAESAGFKIVDDPSIVEPAQPQEQPQEQPQVEAQPEPQPEPQVETQVEQPVVGDTTQQQQPEVNAEDIDIDSEVLSFLSERLGRQFDSYDSISEALSYTPVEIDERVSAINKFVQETGRSPEDWYRYQSLNPSEMDDVALVRLQISSEHPNLSPEEVGMLISNKYKMDEDLHSEDEIKLSKLQLKMDAESARKSIA